MSNCSRRAPEANVQLVPAAGLRAAVGFQLPLIS